MPLTTPSIYGFFQQAVLNNADYQAISKGRHYYNCRAVSDIEVTQGRITCLVRGSDRYQVVFEQDQQGRPQYSCDCPSFRHPCKHIVAALFALFRLPGEKTAIFFAKAAAQDIYLRLSAVEKGRAQLQLVLKKEEIFQNAEADTNILNLCHSFFRVIDLPFNFENNLMIMPAAKLIPLLEAAANKESRFHFYFKDILASSDRPLRLVYPKKRGLKLARAGQKLTLSLKIGQKRFELKKEQFIATESLAVLDLFQSRRSYLIEPDFPDDELNSDNYYVYDGYYFTGEEIVALPQAGRLAIFASTTPGGVLHSLLGLAVEKLAKDYNLEGFKDFSAPTLPTVKPNVTLILEEEQFSKRDIFLKPRLEFIYKGQTIAANDPRDIFEANSRYFLRDIAYEEECLEKIYGEGEEFGAYWPLSAALTFLFERLPKLPADWKINKQNLSFFDFEPKAEWKIELKDEDKSGWFNISFDLPDRLRNTFSKRLIRDILRKKPKYFQVGGKWLSCSEDLVNSISIAYFVGPEALAKGGQEISPFQVMGLWQYFQLNIKEGLPQKITETVAKLRSFDKIEQSAISASLTQVLRPYQKEGVAWLNFLHEHNLSGILCDDMGLGKTLQTLAFLDQLKQKKEMGQCVVVVPTSALGTWEAEARKFVPSLKAMVVDGQSGARKAVYEKWDDQELYIISYTNFTNDFELLKGKSINYLILDEAQFIKNAACKRSRAAFALPSCHRLALTGTPLENHLQELWSIFHFLMPGYLGSFDYFRDTFIRPMEQAGDPAVIDRLREKIRPFMLRRLKEKVEKQLPPKTETPVFCEMTEGQKKIYLHTLSLVREEVFGAINAKGVKQSYIHFFAALTKLRQICNHPALVLDKPSPNLVSGKFESFKELLTEAVEEKHTLLVFSQFTGMLALIRRWLEAEGISHLYLDGGTKKRAELVREFEKGKHPVFLISLKAGGTALTLTQADYVVHFDPWWNPAVERQATDRAHRIGQTKHVFVYKFYCRGTIEEKILQLQKKKQKLFDDIMDNSINQPLQLTRDDIEDILTPNF